MKTNRIILRDWGNFILQENIILLVVRLRGLLFTKRENLCEP